MQIFAAIFILSVTVMMIFARSPLSDHHRNHYNDDCEGMSAPSRKMYIVIIIVIIIIVIIIIVGQHLIIMMIVIMMIVRRLRHLAERCKPSSHAHPSSHTLCSN